MSGMAAQVTQHRPSLGIAMMLGAYLMLSMVDTSVKWLVLAGYNAMCLAFFRYAGAFVISLVQVGAGGWSWGRFQTHRPGLLIFRGFLLVGSTVFNFIALNYLPLTITSAILFSAPIILCALSWPLLGERVGPVRWGAIVVGFIGVLIVVRPFGEDFHWAALLMIFNAVAFALYSVITRKLSGEVAAETMQIYMSGLGTLVLFPFGYLSWVALESWFDLALILGLGFWAWGGHELLTRAHGFAAASTLMPYTYSFMIYLTISSFVVWGHVPDFWTVFGALVIVSSGLVIWARERRVRQS